MLRMRHARQPSPGREKRDWSWVKPALVAVVVMAVALGLAAYAAAASYESVRTLAHQHGLPLWKQYPISLDGGLIGVTVISLTLLAIGQPLWWLRWVARLFALGTIAANAAAGWPDPVGITLRVWPSVLFVVVVEAAQAVLIRHLKKRRQAAEPKRTPRDRIPLARWMLAFGPTYDLWKRMKLWRIRSYTVAIRTELSRQQAVVKLAEHYAPYDWRRDAPQDLVWMLDTGVRIDEALARVATLITDASAVEAAEQAARASAGKAAALEEELATVSAELAATKGALEALQTAVPNPRSRRAAGSAPKARRSAHGSGDTADLTVELRALQMLDAHPELRHKGQGTELARKLGVSPSYGRKLHSRLTTEERPGGALQERAGERGQERTEKRSA